MNTSLIHLEVVKLEEKNEKNRKSVHSCDRTLEQYVICVQ